MWACTYVHGCHHWVDCETSHCLVTAHSGFQPIVFGPDGAAWGSSPGYGGNADLNQSEMQDGNFQTGPVT